MTRNTNNSSKNYKVHSLERGLELIELLSETSVPISLTEISNKANFNLSTSHRILDSLKSRGYVRQDPETNNYCLSLKLIELANKVGWQRLFREEARPIVKELAEKTRQTSYIIVLDNDEALCLERIDGNPHIRLAVLEIGGRMPMNLGAGPRLLMAFLTEEDQNRIIKKKGLVAWTTKSIANPLLLKKDLQDIREKGYSFSDQDVTEGVSAIGCPVKNLDNEVIAAITVAGISSYFTEKNFLFIVEEIRRAADSLSRKIISKSNISY